MNPIWYQNKADALVHAWRMNYGDDPPLNAVVLALSVAIHETRAGDAWPGADGVVGTDDDENNWGATTLRALNAAEYAAIAKRVSEELVSRGRELRGTLIFRGTNAMVWVTAAAEGEKQEQRVPLTQAELAVVTPWLPSVSAGHAQRATNAQAAIQAAGLPMPQANIHCDSAPSLGPYFVWFAAFSNPADGAAYFLKLLAGLKSRKMAYGVLTQGGNEVSLATAMYLAGYYTGFFKKTSYYVLESGKWREVRGDEMLMGLALKKGSDLNIAAYAGALQRITPTIKLALKDWHFPSGEPTEDPAPETDPAPAPRRTLRKGMSGTDVAAVQAQLGKIAVSGNFDSQTDARVREFQQVHGLRADGEVGPLTWAALDGLRVADTDPAPPLIPLDVDWDELRRERDALIREMDP